MVERYSHRSCRNAHRVGNMSPTPAPTPTPSPYQGGCKGNAGCPNGTNRQSTCPNSTARQSTCPNSERCRSLMRQLQTIDFSIVDTVLYLDAYPHCKKAMDHYHSLIHERAELVRLLAEECHTPITNCENASRDSWDWINNPWPWELDANE